MFQVFQKFFHTSTEKDAGAFAAPASLVLLIVISGFHDDQDRRDQGGGAGGHLNPQAGLIRLLFKAAGEGEIPADHIGEAAVARHLRHVSVLCAAGGHAGRAAEGRAHIVRLRGGLRRFGRRGRGSGAGVGFLVVLHAELLDIEVPAVAAAAAEAQAVGLIQLALKKRNKFEIFLFNEIVNGGDRSLDAKERSPPYPLPRKQ